MCECINLPPFVVDFFFFFLKWIQVLASVFVLCFYCLIEIYFPVHDG